MGNAFCAGHKVKVVPSLGHGRKKTRKAVLETEEVGEGKAIHQLACPEGHIMKAHVVREMFNLCSAPSECETCGAECDDHVSYYTCVECDITYCNDCARAELGLARREGKESQAIEIKPGDLFFAGPDKFGIHHVIVARSEWKPVHPDLHELLHKHMEPGCELLCCDTIEATQGSVGDDTWWYPTQTYFVRNPHHDTAGLLADMPPESDELHMVEQAIPTKVMLHPFRPEQGGPEFHEEVFETVITSAADESKKYGKFTAVRSVISGLRDSEVIHAEAFPDKGELLNKLHKSWQARPICASVAIKCWQQYLMSIAHSKEEGVDHILTYMPHWCHKSTPSSMVANLTQHGWVVLDNFES
mmetsp:Transcript_24068/g.60068  ORF Transcript_24068/g.60068 Transcript_24068/m.60068 type:complete len:358 (+) Transcript_24068:85-1158(+)